MGMSLLAVLLGLAGAQAELDAMNDLLGRGYYNSAAQINGPDLIDRYPDAADLSAALPLDEARRAIRATITDFLEREQ